MHLARRFLAPLLVFAALLPFAAPAGAAEPVTASGDALRTSWYPDQPGLSPAVVQGGKFGKVFETPVQGQVYAQPLVSGGTLLVATEANRVYGIDSHSGTIRWERDVGTPFDPDEVPCTDLVPQVGITGTPVIDPDTGTAYFFAKTYASGNPVWEMHAVSITDGHEAPGFPVRISGEAENLAGIQFQPKMELQRPALLLMNGVVYAGFGSHCDHRTYQGWLVGVSTSGELRTMFATSRDGSSIWQAGGGLVSDTPGQILFATGNSFEPTPPNTATPPEDLGEAVARVSIAPDGITTATDFFSPFNRKQLDDEDLDLGSTAPMELPAGAFGNGRRLALVGGKAGTIYVLDANDLGGLGQGAGGTDKIVQTIPGTGSVIGSMATWPGEGGYAYVPGQGGVRVLAYGTQLGQPHFTEVGHTAEPFEFGSGSPVITSTGTEPGSALMWVGQCPKSACQGSTLNAYGPVPQGGAPPLLWSGQIGVNAKFARPGIAENRVYVGTFDNRLIAFGSTVHTLSVSHDEGGSVASEGPGIACGSACSAQLADGSGVTLTATAAAGYQFAGWSGGGCSGTGPCALTLYGDTGVHASFAPAPQPPAPPLTRRSVRRPQTRIAKAVIHRAAGLAVFRFRADVKARFQCRLVPAVRKRGTSPPRFRGCKSPKRYRKLEPGTYTFQVRALNAAGADRTPAKRRFRL